MAKNDIIVFGGTSNEFGVFDENRPGNVPPTGGAGVKVLAEDGWTDAAQSTTQVLTAGGWGTPPLAGVSSGAVPQLPPTNPTDKFLSGDNTWIVPDDDNVSFSEVSTSTKGLIEKYPTSDPQMKTYCSDGVWDSPILAGSQWYDATTLALYRSRGVNDAVVWKTRSQGTHDPDNLIVGSDAGGEEYWQFSLASGYYYDIEAVLCTNPSSVSGNCTYYIGTGTSNKISNKGFASKQNSNTSSGETSARCIVAGGITINVRITAVSESTSTSNEIMMNGRYANWPGGSLRITCLGAV